MAVSYCFGHTEATVDWKHGIPPPPQLPE